MNLKNLIKKLEKWNNFNQFLKIKLKTNLVSV